MLLCEAAGYDVILIETVGVGQSETVVRGMVDYFMLLVLTGAGDELQGMKKGIMELADGIVVHKADGTNEKLAKKTVAEYKQILHFLAPATPNWTTTSFGCFITLQNRIRYSMENNANVSSMTWKQTMFGKIAEKNKRFIGLKQ